MVAMAALRSGGDSLMLNVRPIKESEIDEAKVLIPSDIQEPIWANVFVVVDDAKIIGLFGIQKLLIAEPLYVDGDYQNKRSLVTKMLWYIDGMLRSVAVSFGLDNWQAFVKDDNAAFQQFIESDLPCTWRQETSGKWYKRTY